MLMERPNRLMILKQVYLNDGWKKKNVNAEHGANIPSGRERMWW
jgi:hypothetical protein